MASEHRDIPFETLLKYYIKVLIFALLKNIAKLIKAVCSADVNELVLVMPEEPYVSAHNHLPDM